jgi:hypothetical protein
MICCRISKEMSSLYFGIDLFSLFDARAPESDRVHNSTVDPVFQEESIRRQAEYKKPKIQRRHHFADLKICHL